MKIYLLIMSVLIPFASFSQKKHPVNYYGSAGIGFANSVYIGKKSAIESTHDIIPLFSYQLSFGLKKNITEKIALGIEPNYLRRADNTISYNYIYYTLLSAFFVEFAKKKSKTGLRVSFNYHFFDKNISDLSIYNEKTTSVLYYKVYNLNDKLQLMPLLYFDIYPLETIYNSVPPYQVLFTCHAYNELISVVYTFGKN